MGRGKGRYQDSELSLAPRRLRVQIALMKAKRKNIALDTEAYHILKTHKTRSETWSDVVKKTVTVPLEGKDLVKELKKLYRGNHEATSS